MWSRGLRRWQRPELKTADDVPTDVSAELRRTTAFDYEFVSANLQHPIEIEGRLYNYVFYPGAGDTLAVHFSAFFDESGELRRFREFRGYFHRLRMFWPLAEHSFLFLVDTFGAEQNGCYYKGVGGDFFVERAMDEIIGRFRDVVSIPDEQTVTLGSSMGGTAALRFGLRHGSRGIVAVCPHIDLDISALHQGRVRHVAAILGDDDVTAHAYFPVTREIRQLAATVSPLPRLAVQSMLDDAGVHEEQVLPLVELWQAREGPVRTDYHAVGGHTSDYATQQYFADALAWCFA